VTVIDTVLLRVLAPFEETDTLNLHTPALTALTLVLLSEQNFFEAESRVIATFDFFEMARFDAATTDAFDIEAPTFSVGFGNGAVYEISGCDCVCVCDCEFSSITAAAASASVGSADCTTSPITAISGSSTFGSVSLVDSRSTSKG
jgi:hypothetical protein